MGILTIATACFPVADAQDRARPLQDAGFLYAVQHEAGLTDLYHRDLAFVDVQQPDTGMADSQIMQDAAQWPIALLSPRQMSLQHNGQCKKVLLMAEPDFIVTADAGISQLEVLALKPIAARAQFGLVKIFAQQQAFRICAQPLPNGEDQSDQVMMQAQNQRGENFTAQISIHIYAEPSAFAAAVIDVQYGDGAGFGQENFPETVFGPPQGMGDMAGSMDVLSLGAQGEIILDLGQFIIDAAGPDLLVFENAFGGFVEPAEISLSEDGLSFISFPCEAQAPYHGCAGLQSVWSNSENDRDPTQAQEAGGDAFDLANISLNSARYIKIRDVAGQNLGGNAAGFDLDAVAAIHRLPVPRDGNPHLEVPERLSLRPGECAALQADLAWGQSPQKRRLALPADLRLEETGIASLQFEDQFICAEAVGEVNIGWNYGPLSATTRVIVSSYEDAGE